MAFKFARIANSNPANTIQHSNISPASNAHQATPHKSSPTPAWLKDNSSMKHFPKAYLGYLGQVQMQPNLDLEKNSTTTTTNNNNNNNNNNLSCQSLAGKLVKSRVISLDGWADTSRVQQLLSTSRLSNDSLAAIWAFCNKTRPGTLTNREVCLALALIAIFQRVREQQLQADPFALLKLEPVPPVPKLYETARESATKGSSRLPNSSSMPLDLGDLLINIDSDSNEKLNTKTNCTNSPVFSMSNNAISCLIDMDADQAEPTKLTQLSSVWQRTLLAMQSIFKRSFDVLNVENSRSSALEALKTPKGSEFCKHLSLCYCLSFNIFKFILSLRNRNNNKSRFVDDNYLKRMEDLMVSINEYWAVLINLFHQSGLSDFIELLMDGLNNKTQVVIKSDSSETLQPDDQLLALQEDRCNSRCAICMNEIFLCNIGDALEKLPQEDIELLFDIKLVTLDECHYYHSKCANFWLNNVADSNGELPFKTKARRNEHDDAILKPTTNSKY